MKYWWAYVWFLVICVLCSCSLVDGENTLPKLKLYSILETFLRSFKENRIQQLLSEIQAPVHMVHEITVILFSVCCIFKNLGATCHFFKTDSIICIVLSLTNLPLFSFCCFISDIFYKPARREGFSGQQGQADYIGGKAEALQQVLYNSCISSKDVQQCHHIDFWINWINLPWNKTRRSMERSGLHSNLQPPQRIRSLAGVDYSHL